MSSSTTNLCDIPLELTRLIAERTDTRSRCVLRKCCKDYRKLVDNSTFVCEAIRVTLDDPKKISIGYDNNCFVTYTSKDDGCEVVRRSGRGESPEARALLNGRNHLETAIRDLMTILQNRRLILKNLSISSNLGDSEHTGPFIKALHDKLSTLNHQLYVEKGKLWRFSEDEMMQILPFYQPGTLKIVKVALKSAERGRLSQIINSEQWKQAEELVSTVVEPMDEVLHFKKVIVHRQSYLITLYRIPWEELKSFIEKVIAQSETSPLEFHGELVAVDDRLWEYHQNFPRIPAVRIGETRSILKVLKDGRKIVLVDRNGYLGIHKYSADRDPSY